MTFTKEQLIERCKEAIASLKPCTGLAETKSLACFEIALEALAGMEAEPVAHLYSASFERGHVEGELTDAPGCDMPVYSAPQPLTTSERAELEEYRNAQQVVPGDIDARMKSAGMLSASEIIAGQPIDAFLKHAGVVDMGSLLQWAEMRRAEFLRIQARYELGDKEKDDLYEWVISHVAVFSELHVNIRAAMQTGANMAAQLESARLHIAELEAAPPAPVGYGESPVPLMPDFPGRTLTQRECYRMGVDAGKALNDWTDSRNSVRREHAGWSQSTFGSVGPVGPLKHLSKEALEAAAEPNDLSEWADMQFLLWDAQRRAGITDDQITQAMLEKLEVNKARNWPEPKDGEPRMHIKAAPQ